MPELTPDAGDRLDNESWVITAGDRVIQKKARVGFDRLSTWERLVYSLWVADYGMRNAGDLGPSRDLYAAFQPVAVHAAEALSLPTTRHAFALTPAELEEKYFALFEAVCAEIRNAEPSPSTNPLDR